MANLKDQLLVKLRTIDGLEDRPSPVSGGTALLFRNRDFAHFHNDNELDLRLTKKVIAELGLAHPKGSRHHPTRSQGSPWIEIRYQTADDLDRVCDLVKIAIAQL